MDDTELDEAADRMLQKVRDFADSLDEHERSLFAALIAPGVAAAWNEVEDVEGFGVAWSSSRVQEHLRSAIRAHDLRIEGWSEST